MRLELPRGIDVNGNIITFDGGPDPGPGTVTCDNESDTVEAFFTSGPPVSYPDGESVCVKQGGRYLLLHHSKNDLDEGRGVELFDNFTQYNTRRVAQELLDHQAQGAGGYSSYRAGHREGMRQCGQSHRLRPASGPRRVRRPSRDEFQ